MPCYPKIKCMTGNDYICMDQQCDGIQHCLDGSDEFEEFCTYKDKLPDYLTTEKPPSPIIQPSTAKPARCNFRCKNGQCLDFISKRCNGFIDCADGSDELFCENKSNKPLTFLNISTILHKISS